MLGEMKTLKVENERANVDLNEIVKKQIKEKEIMEKEVVKPLQKNEELVSDVDDKKSVIIFGRKKHTNPEGKKN